MIYLVMYLYDMLIDAKAKSDTKKLKGLLNAEFDMKGLGAAQIYSV